MRRVTLNGIKRRGLSEWSSRAWWNARKVRIWNGEHHLWWRSEGCGYTKDESEAGLYDFADAYERTKHCGPEKHISYYASH